MAIVNRAGLLLVAVSLFGVPRMARAAVTSEQVRTSIQRAIAHLRRAQRPNGGWADLGAYQGGTTALVTLALLTAGLPPDDRTVADGLRILRTLNSTRTYVVALQLMALAKGDPKRDKRRIGELAVRLANGQHSRGRYMGMWGYTVGRGGRRGRADNSNTQFALLGLRAAVDVGVHIDQRVWQRGLKHWISNQTRDGGWGYGSGASYGSMSCAGVASLVICGSSLEATRARWANGRVVNCGKYAQNKPLARGLIWLTKNFSVTTNPRKAAGWYYYYMYALERAGRLSGQRFFGMHDWYRKGAESLLRAQSGATGAWRSAHEPVVLATSFALLFLAKGSYPVLINKLKWDGDWDNSRYDAHNLVAEISRLWDYNMAWQAVDVAHCRLQDLMMAPVVYFSGHKAPRFTDAEKRLLVRYIEQGGFIFAEACCSRKAFDAGFRELMKELFGKSGMTLHRLDPEHPIWTAQYKLDPDTYPLEGLDFGCRTCIVYSPKLISSVWEGPAGCPRDVRLKAFRMGTNIVAYATGKERPKDKLAERVVDDEEEKPDDTIRRNALQLAKIRHNGQWNVASSSVPNLMGHLRQKANLDVIRQQRELTMQDPTLRVYPLAYMSGRSGFTFSDKDRTALRHYIQQGGTLMADATCGSDAFDQAFRQMVAQVFPKHPLQRVPPEHPLFTRVGYKLDKVEYTRAVQPPITTPFIEAVTFNGRLAVIYSKYDLGCALTRTSTFGCRGYKTPDAFRVAANIVLYAMTQ